MFYLCKSHNLLAFNNQ